MNLEKTHAICDKFVTDVRALGPEYSCECGICTRNELEPVTAKVVTTSAYELIRLLATHLRSTAAHLGWTSEQIIQLAMGAAQLAIADCDIPVEGDPGALS